MKSKSIQLSKSSHFYVPFLSRCIFGFRGTGDDMEITQSYGITHGHSLFNSFNKYLYILNYEDKALTMIALERFNILSMSWRPNCCLSPSLYNFDKEERPNYIGISMIMMDGNTLKTDNLEIELVKEFLEEE